MDEAPKKTTKFVFMGPDDTKTTDNLYNGFYSLFKDIFAAGASPAVIKAALEQAEAEHAND